MRGVLWPAVSNLVADGHHALWVLLRNGASQSLSCVRVELYFSVSFPVHSELTAPQPQHIIF